MSVVKQEAKRFYIELFIGLFDVFSSEAPLLITLAFCAA